MVSNIRTNKVDDRRCSVAANWQTHSYRFDETTTFFGRYSYLLAREGERLLIEKKKIVVLNDLIPTVLDIYNV
jgi:3-phenylpropionate/cinnamic acid dioxygenase small subunit